MKLKQKNLTIIVFILFALVLAKPNLCFGQEKALQGQLNFQNKQGTTSDAFFSQKTNYFNYFKDIASRGVSLFKNRFLALANVNVNQWLIERKEGIKQGIEEEKKELQYDFQDGVKKFFKDIFKSLLNTFQ